MSDKFIYYDLDGNYQRTIWINDNIINSFITLADKCLAFFVDIPGYTENNDEIIIVDSLGEIVNSFITRRSNDLLHGRFDNDTYFATSDSGVYFITIFDDKI